MSSLRQGIRGQGMTEYIVIVSLIASGALGLYAAFDDAWRLPERPVATSRDEPAAQTKSMLDRRSGNRGNSAQVRDPSRLATEQTNSEDRSMPSN